MKIPKGKHALILGVFLVIFIGCVVFAVLLIRSDSNTDNAQDEVPPQTIEELR
jgi:hypothetical protein